MSSARKETGDISQTPIGKALKSITDLLKILQGEKDSTLKQEKINALTHLLKLILMDKVSPQYAVNQVKETFPTATKGGFFKNGSRVAQLFDNVSKVKETYSQS